MTSYSTAELQRHDHVRIERLLFDAALEPKDGSIRPDRARSGFGLEFERVF